MSATRPRVAVVMNPKQRHENLNQAFFDAVGDRFDLVMQETPSPTGQEIALLIRDADALITGWGTPAIPAEAILQAQRLRLVVHAQGGVKGLPYEAILGRGVVLTNSAHAYARTMGESTVGMMLALGYHMRYAHELFTHEQTAQFDRGAVLGIGLDGKAAGVVGPRGMLVCNARMPIVDEDALYELVLARKIYAALNLIPLRKDLWLNPALRGLPNLLMTHGSSNVSDTWYDQVSRNVALQLLNFFDGRPVFPRLTLEQVALST